MTTHSRRTALAVLLLFVVASSVPVRSQALPSLANLAVNYATQKRKLPPDGELKTQIDGLDREIADARRLGRTGELRRLYGQGLTLLSGRPWTDDLEFARSLVLRTDRVIVDSSVEWSLRLEQIYPPAIVLERPLSARITLRQPAVPARGEAPAQPMRIVKDFGTRDGVARDLRESPLHLHLDLAGVDDGRYNLAVEVFDGTRLLGTTVQAIAVRKGVDGEVDRLRRAAASAPEATRASILFPVDRMQVVNRGGSRLATFNVEADFAAAEAVAAAATAGKDPFAGRTGDFKRHYVLQSAGEILPYRMYVPASYTPGTRTPLLLMLHGLNGDEDQLFDAYGATLRTLADQHGVILAAPLGYRVDGWYGWPGFVNPDDPEARRTVQHSEDDVMAVLQQVKTLYTVDDARTYLMGHSMGAIGTWYLGPKFADLWAGLGAIAGIGDEGTVEHMRHIPQFVVHGDADATVPVDNSRRMVAKMKALGMTVTYVEVPGGDHVNIAVPNLPAMFEFFKAHTKGAR